MAEEFVIRDLSRKAAEDAAAAVARAARLADTPEEMGQIAYMAAGEIMGMAAGFMTQGNREHLAQMTMVLALTLGRLMAGGPDDCREEAFKDYQILDAAGRGVSGPGVIGDRMGSQERTNG